MALVMNLEVKFDPGTLILGLLPHLNFGQVILPLGLQGAKRKRLLAL